MTIINRAELISDMTNSIMDAMTELRRYPTYWYISIDDSGVARCHERVDDWTNSELDQYLIYRLDAAYGDPVDFFSDNWEDLAESAALTVDELKTLTSEWREIEAPSLSDCADYIRDNEPLLERVSAEYSDWLRSSDTQYQVENEISMQLDRIEEDASDD